MSSGAAIGLSALGTGMGMYAAYEAGKANQKINNYNAAVSDIQASDALARGEQSTADYGVQTKKLVGAQKAAYAAQGIDLGTGSAADVQDTTQVQAARDVQTIRLNAMREAWGYKTQAKGFRLAGKYAYQGGVNSAIGQGLSGAGQVAYMASQRTNLAGNTTAPTTSG